MPIQFRCHHCRQVLSITSKKAGREVVCPNCRESTRVPTMEDVAAALQGAPSKKAASRRAPEPEPVAEEPSQASAPPVDEDGSEWTSAGVERNPWTDEEADEEPGFSLKRRKADESRPDMTPMADIVFLLLTFFMLTASFTVQKSMQADPPEPEEEGASAAPAVVQEVEQDEIVVGISENDELTLDDQPVGGMGALADALRAKAAGGATELSLTIEADPRCSFGAMVGVMDAGISTGMQRIRRITRPLNE